MMAEKKKGIWTFVSFNVSLFLLLMACCLYSGGKWLFVAEISVLFGLSVVFLPFTIGQLPLKGFARHNKGLLVMAADTVLFYLLIITCGFYANPVNYWRPALLISTFAVIYVWMLFGIIRYLKANGFIRAGLSVFAIGLPAAFTNDIIIRIIDGTRQITLAHANLTAWSTNELINANIYLLILLASCAAGAILLLIGFMRRGKSSR